MSVSELADSRATPPAGPSPAARRDLSSRWTAPALAAALLTLLGVFLRLMVARQSLFGDELSTYWIVATHRLGDVLSLLYGTASIHHAEITPPLYFLASWLTTQLGHSPELLRAPSLVAGALSIPVMYQLGLRTAGRRAALVSTALTALSPFMIYYSAEARAYAVLMLLVMASTLAMLLAVDTGRTRWWVLYGVCSCAAFYTHYTCAFVLGAQLLWLVWAHPDARRPALLANLGAVAGLLPWTTGLINDFTSPTVNILSALSPFTAHDVRIALGHWAIGYPYANSASLSALPGSFALVLLALATIIAVTGTAGRLYRQRIRRCLARRDSRVVLIFALALATPLGEAIVSSFSTHVFGVRNLAASWPALALAFAVLLTSAGPRLGLVAAGLAVASFALGGGRMLFEPYERPDYQAAADYIQHDEVVIDETGEISPGPLTPLDITLHTRVPVFRAGAPAEHVHPFGFADPMISLAQATQQAVAAAHGGPIAVVSTVSPRGDISQLEARTRPRDAPLPARYRLIRDRVYPGIARAEVKVYSQVAARRG